LELFFGPVLALRKHLSVAGLQPPKLAVAVANSAAEPPAVLAVALIAVTVPVPETVVPVTAPVEFTVVNEPAALVVPPMTVLSIVPPLMT
jgi:hypothetical protein